MATPANWFPQHLHEDIAQRVLFVCLVLTNLVDEARQARRRLPIPLECEDFTPQVSKFGVLLATERCKVFDLNS